MVLMNVAQLQVSGVQYPMDASEPLNYIHPHHSL